MKSDAIRLKRRDAWRSPLALAAAALLAGYAVYAVARPGTDWFLLWHATHSLDSNGSPFWWLIDSAPSFLHTLAFALLLALAVGGDRGRRYAACVAWGAIEFIAELAQLPSSAQWLAVHQTADESSVHGLVAGTFSFVDLVAVLLGTALAICYLHSKNETEELS